MRTGRDTLNRPRKHNDNAVALLFLLPALAGFLIFIIFPVVASLLLSFTKWDFLSGFGNIKFVGLDNFKYLLGGDDVWFNASFVNTLGFSIATVVIGMFLSLVIAVLLDKYVFAPGVFRVIVFIPYISSIVASVIVWQVVFQPSYGPVNEFLFSLGIQNPPKWFVDVHWALPMIIIFSIWQTLGYNVVVFLAGLKNISKELYEAADIDGASEIQKFFKITVSMISPTTFFLTTMGIISSFKVFDAIKVATGGGPGRATSVVAFYIYREAFEQYRMGTASAAAWIMFIFIFLVTLIQLRGQKKWVTYE